MRSPISEYQYLLYPFLSHLFRALPNLNSIFIINSGITSSYKLM